MGENTKLLRSRMKSVDSTLRLTKAMGLVASSKIRRATDAMEKARQYESAFTRAVERLASVRECQKSPYVQAREAGKDLYVVIAGDRGLAGGYNANVFRHMREKGQVEIIAIGKRAADRYGNGYRSAEQFSAEDGTALAKELCEKYVSGEYRSISVVGTHYLSMMSQEVSERCVLPLAKSEAVPSGIIFEPDEATVLQQVAVEYVTAVIMREVRESFASEVAARRVAMDSAGKNAQEMIDALQLQYNRARQGAITQEITEIVAGSGL